MDSPDITMNHTQRTFFQHLVTLQGIEQNLDENCTTSITDPKQCIFPQYLLKYITPPVFILNSAYDVYQLIEKLTGMELVVMIVLLVSAMLTCAGTSVSSDDRLLVNMTVVHSTTVLGAYCLDGSLPAYHIHRGFGAGARNWLLQFERELKPVVDLQD
ncbi:unnamed protein product [Lactuca saligna]|uniref:Pectin acetylesterase n=1 Tax=Lactuca saligna TaxID=75948 RepID=A0AA36EFY2_LACSI|nr:unnamed protein product [Lactuca saligna]